MAQPESEGELRSAPSPDSSPRPGPAGKDSSRRAKGEPYIPLPSQTPVKPSKTRSWLIAALAAALAVGAALHRVGSTKPVTHAPQAAEAINK